MSALPPKADIDQRARAAARFVPSKTCRPFIGMHKGMLEYSENSSVNSGDQGRQGHVLERDAKIALCAGRYCRHPAGAGRQRARALDAGPGFLRP
jgi:hypothetical protein